MKSLILAATALTFLMPVTTAAQAGVLADGLYPVEKMIDGTVEKRRKRRIPGGSGCDDPRDLIEYPECAG
ncbi:MAG: hypothetical protein ACT4OK_12725 [Gemmobacter sp.]